MNAGAKKPDAGAGWPRPYIVLLAVCITVVGGIETLLLRRKYDLFTGGFLAVEVLDTFWLRCGFLLGSILLDLFLIIAVWSIVAPLLRRLRLSSLRSYGLLGFAAMGVALSIDYLEYQIHHYMGDLISFRYLWDVSDRNPAELIAQGIGQIDPMVFLLGAGLLAVAGIVTSAGRLERVLKIGNKRAFSPPPTRSLFRGLLVMSMVCLVGLAVLSRIDSPVGRALRKKPSGSIAFSVLQLLTDFDRDGYSLLSLPMDADLFDSSIHPYARDIPGNGIDENGVGGDHPEGFRSPYPEPEERPRFSRKPHVLLILLESVRADLIHRRLGEREVTPFLNMLATEGASSGAAYSHNGYTVPSRAQLFGGRVNFHPGQSTLIDDFKANGYRIGYFSGQDDSFGDSGPLVGYERADVFYDARQDVDKRYTQFATPASLAVSWKIVNARAVSFIEAHDPSVPLFLYVNYHDTHFPYHHREIDNILGIKPIPRSWIRPGVGKGLWETYANSAANVDGAIGILVDTWKKHLEGREKVIIVTSDHGEELFDHGLLGHGISLNPEQLRVPLILWGTGGEWPEPIGMADIRYYLQRALSLDSASRSATFVSDPGRRILQYVGALNSPRILAWRGASDCLAYDFHTRRFGRINGRHPLEEVLAATEDPLFHLLIRTWEELTIR